MPDLAAAVAAVRSGNAAALHALDRAWTPFYCWPYELLTAVMEHLGTLADTRST